MLDKDKAILVVDDIQPARETILNILRVLGFKRFFEASNGEEAKDIIEKNYDDIQLIISDWKMPVLNGLDLLRWIRRNDKYKDMLFIFTTSKGEKEDIALASEEGIEGYLLKPVTIDSVIKKIEQLKNKSNPSYVVKEFLHKVQELVEKNKPKEALSLLEKGIEEYPHLKARLSFEAAKVCRILGKLEKSKEYLQEAVKESSLMVKAWSLLAEVYLEEKDYLSAIGALEKALNINPNSTNNLFLLGKIYLIQKDLYKARDYFTMALNSDPENTQLKQDIWNIYLQLDLVEEVMRDFGPMLFDTLTVDTLNNLAVSFRKQGKIDDAIKVYKQALKKEPENEKVMYNLAVAYVNLGSINNALKYLKKVLEKDAGFTPAKELWEKITVKAKKKKKTESVQEDKEKISDK